MVANRFLSSKPLYDETTANLAAFGMTGWDFTLTSALYESLSLQDIFETNNLVQALSSWGYSQPPGAFVSTEEIGFGGTYSSTYAEDAVTLTTAEKHYFAFRIYDVLKFAVTNILDTEDYVAVAEYVDGTIRLRKAQSVEFTPTLTDGIRLELVESNSGRISYARLINVDTSFTTAPSKAQLDMWYNIYVFLKTKGTETTGALDNDYYIDITNKVLVEPTATFTTAQEIAGFKIKMADSLNVTHFQAQKSPGFTNIYGTAFLVWQTLTLAAIFGEGYVVDPSDTLQVPTVWANQYYDTETKAITVGTLGGNLIFTNNTESPITVYVVNITATFNIKPNVTQMNDMEKMFLMSGTTSEILVLLGGNFYVDYTNNTIYNLSTIYGSGNEPNLATFEELLSPVLKAKSFENTLQQEYMQLSLDTPVYEGLSLRDIFESGNLVDETFASGWQLNNATGIVDNEKYNFTANAQYGRVQSAYSIVSGNQYYLNSRLKVISSNQVGIAIMNSGGSAILATSLTDYQIISGIRIATANSNTFFGIIDYRPSGWTEINVDYFYVINLSTTFTTAPTQTQLDEWLDIYLTLTSNNSKTGTAFVQDRFYIDYDNAKAYDFELVSAYAPSVDEVVYEGLSYRDIFESGNLVNPVIENITGYVPATGASVLSYEDNFLKIVTTISSSGAYYYVDDLINKNVYYSLDIKYSGLNSYSIRFGNYFSSSYSNTDLERISDIGKSTNTAVVFYLRNYNDGIIYSKNIYLLDLDTLFTIPPTQAQLDTWLATYLARQPQALVESILAKTITLTGIPVKAKIYKDRVVILGSYVVVGE